MELIQNDETLVTKDLFAPIQKMCFDDMCQNTFHRFKAAPEFTQYKTELRDTYNKVTVDDFDYLEVLGSGGFGRVVHARKKSTGKHYGTYIIPCKNVKRGNIIMKSITIYIFSLTEEKEEVVSSCVIYIY
jgi:hypothetical protein